jgi:hypothetical protein
MLSHKSTTARATETITSNVGHEATRMKFMSTLSGNVIFLSDTVEANRAINWFTVHPLKINGI